MYIKTQLSCHRVYKWIWCGLKWCWLVEKKTRKTQTYVNTATQLWVHKWYKSVYEDAKREKRAEVEDWIDMMMPSGICFLIPRVVIQFNTFSFYIILPAVISFVLGCVCMYVYVYLCMYIKCCKHVVTDLFSKNNSNKEKLMQQLQTNKQKSNQTFRFTCVW